MAPDVLVYVFGTIAAFLVGFSKGGIPMVGMLGVPMLALAISPVAAAALLLPLYVVSDMVGLYLFRRSFDWRNLMILGPGATLGIAFGWASYTITSESLITLLVGLIGLTYFANALYKRGQIAARPADIPRGLFWGFLTGFTSFVSHSGAPPYQMYVLPQKLEKLVFAGTTTVFFAYVNAVKLIPYWALGQFNTRNLETAAMLSPVAVAGAFAGYHATKVVPERFFFRVVEVALFLISVKLIYDGLGALL
jgi:uncharacterized membrane protein YfcA